MKCAYVVVCAFMFSSLSSVVFRLGQKYSSWYCTVVCMRKLGEGPIVVQERVLSPFFVCGHWHFVGVGFWERAGDCPNVNLCNCCFEVVGVAL